MERTMREIGVLKIIRHPNVIQLIEAIDTMERLYVVLEYVDGGELFDYIVAHQRLKEHRAKKIFRDIVEAIEYCHSLNIIHRDLKPENILLDKHKNIKLIDFGLSNTLRRDFGLRSRCGSPYYVAPEMVAGKGYGSSVDVWSLGVVLYSILTGDVPFSDNNLTTLLEKIVEGKYHIPRYLSEDAKDLIRNLLVTEPSKRFTISDIRRHPWTGMNSGPPEMPELSVTITLPLDESIVRQMDEVGFDQKLVSDYIRTRTRNGVTNMYRLLLSRKRAADREASHRSASLLALRDSSGSNTKMTADSSVASSVAPASISVCLPPVSHTTTRAASVSLSHDSRHLLHSRIDKGDDTASQTSTNTSTPTRSISTSQARPDYQAYAEAIPERRPISLSVSSATSTLSSAFGLAGTGATQSLNTNSTSPSSGTSANTASTSAAPTTTGPLFSSIASPAPNTSSTSPFTIMGSSPTSNGPPSSAFMFASGSASASGAHPSSEPRSIVIRPSALTAFVPAALATPPPPPATLSFLLGPSVAPLSIPNPLPTQQHLQQPHQQPPPPMPFVPQFTAPLLFGSVSTVSPVPPLPPPPLLTHQSSDALYVAQHSDGAQHYARKASDSHMSPFVS
eukprot:TRINITY_DN5647_c0_g1_i1.p1 TRINITY_DN5647_c0_g1~~TRINITY_DN5647_c0_g1_i1.p1  ORF type:complete len:620 (+),score=142.87 TRINITY_DN5647_c0_g1_i1:129-1988(+)